MDDHTTSAPESAQSIRIPHINPLLPGGPRGADTIGKVAAVLSALSCLSVTDDADPDSYEFGMSLIHRWLEKSLTFVAEHPEVDAVLPVSRRLERGGAS